MSRRAILIVLDGVGAGELPDAADYGDSGSNTLGNLSRAVSGLDLPALGSLGLGHVTPIQGVPAITAPRGAVGRLAEKNPGKDSTSGHWEIAGVHLTAAFPTYPHGFPADVIRMFEERIGRKTLGNEVASGTEIIQRLGPEHLTTGFPIVYTSADSVFQVAAHEELIPLPVLYDMCRTARTFLTGEHGVGRVIARPFLGAPGDFRRTENRRDFSIEPTGITLLDLVSASGLPVTGIGKIVDLFAGRGITNPRLTHNNGEGMAEIDRALETRGGGLIMANLVDFDMLWGHRNDPEGFRRGLSQFDSWLGGRLGSLREEDLLLITADHGNDPTTPSTDHSREYIPLVAAGPRVRGGVNLGIRPTFSDLGATVADHLRVGATEHGTSFHAEIWK